MEPADKAATHYLCPECLEEVPGAKVFWLRGAGWHHYRYEHPGPIRLACGPVEPMEEEEGSVSGYRNVSVVGKTRAAHQCFECQQVIPVGARCVRVFGTHWGDVFSHYAHEDCDQAGGLYFLEVDLNSGDDWYGLREEVCRGGLSREDIPEAVRERYPAVIARVFEEH